MLDPFCQHDAYEMVYACSYSPLGSPVDHFLFKEMELKSDIILKVIEF
jgi:hypothetical protein